MKISSIDDAKAWAAAWNGKPPPDWIEVAVRVVMRERDGDTEAQKVVTFLRSLAPVTPPGGTRRLV
jgi:hypothetical protein